LRRKIERDRFFDPLEADKAFASEEERLEARREFVFKEFVAWLRRYERETDPAVRAGLVPEGVVRATRASLPACPESARPA
jgi:hypothetical protein